MGGDVFAYSKVQFVGFSPDSAVLVHGTVTANTVSFDIVTSCVKGASYNGHLPPVAIIGGDMVAVDMHVTIETDNTQDFSGYLTLTVEGELSVTGTLTAEGYDSGWALNASQLHVPGTLNVLSRTDFNVPGDIHTGTIVIGYSSEFNAGHSNVIVTEKVDFGGATSTNGHGYSEFHAKSLTAKYLLMDGDQNTFSLNSGLDHKIDSFTITGQDSTAIITGGDDLNLVVSVPPPASL